MKVVYRIPTEMYAYVEVTDEVSDPKDDVEEVIARNYRKLTDAFKVKPVNEMPEIEFRKYYDKVGNGESIEGDPGIMQLMSPVQQRSINDLKKFIKRSSYKRN